MPLTIKQIEQLKAANGKQKILWDDKISGFGVRALPSGRKTFILKYRADGGGRTARQRMMKISTVGSISLSEARKLAQEFLYQISSGEDPQASLFDKRKAPIMIDLWDRYQEEMLSLTKSSTQSDYRAYWENEIRPHIGKFKVADVSRKDVQALHTKLKNTPYKANRVRALMSRLFNLAEKWELRESGSNPCMHVSLYPEKAKNRYLSKTEISKLFSALDECEVSGEVNVSICNGIRLLLLTGARKSEIFASRVEWLALAERKLELPDSKTGARTVFLSGGSIEIFEKQLQIANAADSLFLFPSPKKGRPLTNIKKGWNRIRELSSLQDVRLHDLRHTHASIAVGQGMSLPVIGKVLGHSQPRTTQRYAHVASDPAFEAVEGVSDLLKGL